LKNKWLQFGVGVFILLGFVALLWLAFDVSGVSFKNSDGYLVSANFDNVGSLQSRAPVKIAGVVVGRVLQVSLDQKTFRAHVVLRIRHGYNEIPVDSAASIYTVGLLGANYINISPGFQSDYLKPGSVIETTHSAVVLENLIGQLLFKAKTAPASANASE
jgi:phospholipid/cholesterol/gamma-HCH transport system substrate-binding protein